MITTINHMTTMTATNIPPAILKETIVIPNTLKMKSPEKDKEKQLQPTKAIKRL